MKLASLKSNHCRDGELCVVNKTLTLAISVPQIASTLQAALDNWDSVLPQLQDVYAKLNNNLLDSAFVFDATLVTSPLPRAYQWADGSAYVNHVELVRKARGAEIPANFWTDPLIYQGGSDSFIGPRDPIVVADESFGIDFEAEVAVITDDVEMGIAPEKAEQHIRLLMLVKALVFFNQNPPAVFLQSPSHPMS